MKHSMVVPQPTIPAKRDSVRGAVYSLATGDKQALSFQLGRSDGGATARRENCARLFLGNMRIMGYLLNMEIWGIM
jgi:hypothetical protein